MILTCPDCHTRYTVAGAALGGAEGRDVRCTKCGKVWHYQPEVAAFRGPASEISTAPAAAAAPPEPVAENPPPSPASRRHTIERLRAEPTFEPPAPAVDPPPPARSLPEPLPERDAKAAGRPAAARHRRFRIAGFVLTALILGLVLIAIWAREPIMRVWPSAIPFYRSARLADFGRRRAAGHG